jgi:hypothetical protein
MKFKLAHVIVLSGLLLTLFSCDGCNQGPGCDSIWGIELTNQSMIIEIDSVNTTLSLQVPNMNPGGIQGEAYQAYFTGDFIAVAQFSNFVCPSSPCGTCGRPYAEMVMYNSETPDTILDTTFVRAGISSTHIYSMIGLQKDEKPRLITTTSGTFRIEKIGPSLTSQVIAGGDTVSMNLSMPMTPIRFAFRLGSFNDSLVVGTTAIKIDAFNVSGTSGATLFGDDFTCNSIYIP